jgi:hypothetical protein
MIEKIGGSVAADFTAADRRPPPKEPKSKPEPTEAPAADPVAQAPDNLRLVIERHQGGYVYKLIDRDTGQVINAIPRSEIGKMAESPDYGPGHLVSTTA